MHGLSRLLPAKFSSRSGPRPGPLPSWVSSGLCCTNRSSNHGFVPSVEASCTLFILPFFWTFCSHYCLPFPSVGFLGGVGRGVTFGSVFWPSFLCLLSQAAPGRLLVIEMCAQIFHLIILCTFTLADHTYPRSLKIMEGWIRGGVCLPDLLTGSLSCVPLCQASLLQCAPTPGTSASRHLPLHW